MDAILDSVRDAAEAPIDFQGQKLVATLNYILLSLFGVASFIAGFVTQNIFNSLYVGGAGLVLTMLVTVPPWPMYNKRPVKWLPRRKLNGYWIDTEFKIQ